MAGAPQKNNDNDFNGSAIKNSDPNIDNKFDENSLHASSVDCGDYGDNDKNTNPLNLKTPTHSGQ